MLLVNLGRLAPWSAVAAAAVGCAAPCLGQGSFVNWETPPVHAAEITPDGSKLLVVNTADDRLEVFTLGGALPVWAGSIPVGLDPVSVRARSSTEVWVVNQMSDTVSVVSLVTMNVVATLPTGDAPADVVFAGSPQRAFVSVAGPGQLLVIDPANRAAAATVIPLVGNSPRALATSGTQVYAAFFQPGNRTTIGPQGVISDPSGPYAGLNPPPNGGAVFSPPLAPGLPPPPPSSLIMNREGTNWKDANNVVWNGLITWGNAEHSMAIVNAATQAVTYAGPINNNISTALAVQPGTGKVTIAGTHLRNYVRFEPNDRAGFVVAEFATLDPANLASAFVIRDVNQHLFASPPNPAYTTSPTPAQVALSLADPRAVVWNAAGTSMYVAGMGSGMVIRCDAVGTRQATVNVGHGPAGLALDSARSRLYCVNRFDGTVSSINTATDTEVGRVSYYDPTPAVIKTGRPLLYDGHLTSRLGQASCASCHIDGKTDGQAWDLGDPSGAMKAFNQACNAGLPLSGMCNDWHPVKGPMMTQTLQGIIGNGPMHWRGDREDIPAFSVGFTGLLGAAAAPSPAQLQQLSDFLATIQFPPQPSRTMTDTLPVSVPGYPGSPAAGMALFYGPPLGGSLSCVQCHTSSTGGGLTIISGNNLGLSQGMKIPHLRNLYTKAGFSLSSLSNTAAFGYTHDGSVDNVFNFLQGHQASFPSTQQGIDQRRNLEAFLMCFPSGMHPAVGVQMTFDGTNSGDPTLVNKLATALSLADSGVVGVVAKGVVGGLARGYVYIAGTGNMQSDRHLQVVAAAGLRTGAALGAEMTFTVVPIGTQVRIGVDRDGDGYFDRDEIDAGSNPNDPLSVPVCYANCDGSTAPPILNVNDFACFLNRYAAGDPYANCDGSTVPPVLNVNDFACFLNRYAAGCP